MTTALIEDGDVAATMGSPSAGQPGTMGARRSQQPVGFQAGGPGGEPMIVLGSIELGFEDVFLLLIALQTLGVLVDLYREVSE